MAGLRFPFESTARTPKMKLSFESGSVTRVRFPTAIECCQSGLDVVRHTTS